MTQPGSANLGTVHGKVKIEYESSGAAKATKELAVAQKAVADFQKQLDKGISLGANLTIITKDISVDRRAFNGAIEKWQNSVRLGTIGLQANFKITPRQIQIDSSALSRAIGNFQRTQSIGLSSGATVMVRPVVDMTQLQALANQVRNVFGRIVADQSQYGRQAASSFGTGYLTSATLLRHQGQQVGQQTGMAMAAGIGGTLAKSTAITAGVAAIGYVFKQGFDRIESLDTAAAKLKALGFQTNQIKEISKNALESVKGTAFGLDQAFNAAANAISAGIKPGAELTAYLKNVADNAALAGVSMADMGDIFNEVAVEGKLTGEVVDRLQSRGVDVFGNLAKSLHVTQAAAHDMVTNGTIDFEKFRTAMNLNSGAAVVMGQTISGSFQNLMAGVKRVAALFLKPIFGDANGQTSQFAKGIQLVTEKIAQLENWMGNNQSKIVTFWEYAAKGALAFGLGVNTMAIGVSAIITGIVKGLALVARGWEFAFKAVGAKGLEKDAKGVKDALNDWGDSAWDVTKDMGKFEGTIVQSINAVDKWADSARKSGSAAGDLGAKFNDAAKPATTLKDVLDKMSVKENEFTTALQGGTTEFNKFLKALKDKGATEGFLNFVKNLRSEFNNGGSAAKNFKEAIEKLGDANATAADKASTLILRLKEMGVIPNDDALQSYSEYIEKLGDAANSAIDPLSKLGDALVNADGRVNFASGKNAQALSKALTDAQQQFTQLAASGTVVPEEAYANIQKNLHDAFTGSYGLSGDVADQLIQTYLPKDKLLGALKNAGDPTAAAKAIFGDKPAELKAVLDLLTKQDDLMKQIVPEGVLKIPAEIVAKPGSSLEQFLDIASKIKEATGVDPSAGKPGVAKSKNEYPAGPIGDYLRILDQANSLNTPTPQGTPGSAAGITPSGPPVVPGSIEHKLGADTGPTGRLAGALGLDPNAVAALNDPKKLADLLQIHPDISQILLPQIVQAGAQGQNFAQAFAEGIDSASEDVKQAIIKLAQLSEGLGNSPAPWGPLSGKGWTLSRGKVFGKAYADGITATAGQVKGAVEGMAQSSVLSLDDRLTQAIKDMQDLSDLGKSFFNVGKQIADIAVGTLKFANDMSGGRLFPKHYIKDPNKIPKDNTSTGFNPDLLKPNLSGITGGNPITNTAGAVNPGTLNANSSQQDVANYIINKALSQGYSRSQADKFVVQAFGESGLKAGARGVNTGDATGAADGVFQFTPGTWGNRSGSPMDAQRNIDEYFNLAKERGLTPESFTNGTQLGTQVSKGGPWHPANTGHLAIAQKGAQQFIDAYTSGNQQDSLLPALPPGTKPPSGLTLPPGTTIPESNGLSSAAQSLDAFAKSLIGAQYEMGGFSQAAIDCSGAVSAITNFATGIEPFAKRASTVNMGEFLASKGFQVGRGGAGDLRVGWWDKGGGANGHTALTLPSGLNAESTTSNGISGFRLGDKAVGSDDKQFTNQMFLPGSQIGATGPIPVALDNAKTGALDGVNLSLGTPSQIQDIFKNNPSLMDTGVAPEQRLQAFDAQISDLTRQGTPEAKKQADYLSGIRSKTMDQYGLKEAPSDLETAQNVISGASGVVSSVFSTIDSTIKSIGAAKDLGDTFVRGVANTSDVNRVIDDFQNFIELGQRVAQLTSDITGFAAQMVGSGASGDPSGGAAGAAAALGAVSTISGLVSQGFAAANAVIDLGQEVARIAGKYAGRAITSLLGFPGAQDMKFLLDTTTGQLKAYTSENPQDKHTFDTLGRKFGQDKYIDQRSSPANTFYIYQGPGQDPRDTMNDAMFAVKSSGQGAFGYAQQKPQSWTIPNW